MTAFEIVMNYFFDSIERNEPKEGDTVSGQNANELFEVVRQIIETSFAHGHKISYTTSIKRLIDQAGLLFHHSGHEAWEKVRYAFIENDLNTIKRDRNRNEMENLKTRLIHSF